MKNFRLYPETSSSASHAIVRGSGNVNMKSITFSWGEYCWGVDEVSPENYLWTSILMTEDNDYIEACKKCLTEYLSSKGVEDIQFVSADGGYSGWYYPVIDHQGYEGICNKLIDYSDGVASIRDEHTFDDYITGTVYTGNDNDDCASPWSDNYRYDFDRDNTMF